MVILLSIMICLFWLMIQSRMMNFGSQVVRTVSPNSYGSGSQLTIERDLILSMDASGGLQSIDLWLRSIAPNGMSSPFDLPMPKLIRSPAASLFLLPPRIWHD